jgi:hypothetical protein
MALMHDEAAVAASHVPLGRVALCLDCDSCFKIGYDACPACGSRAWALVARFLSSKPRA